MNIEALQPSQPSRTMSGSVRVTAAVAAMLGVYGVAVRDASTGSGYWIAIAAGLVLAGFGSRRFWSFADGRPWWLLYGFAVPGVALMTWFVAAVAPGPVELWLPLWGLHAINGGFSLPPRGQLLFHGIGTGSLAFVLVARGLPVEFVLLDLGLYAVLAVTVMRMGSRLREVLEAQRGARAEAENRRQLLLALARMNELDVSRAAEATIRGMAELGYEMSTLGLVDETQTWLRSVATTGFDDDEFADEPLPIGDGLAGEAVTQQRMVFVEDYQTWEHKLGGRGEVRGAVAVPIEIDGRVRGVLQGARRSPGIPGPQDLEVIELLAAQATRVLRNAARFDDERRRGDQLRQLDQLKSDFISSVSHELRTPLTVIQGAGHTLAGRVAELSPQQRGILLERLNANAERLDQMIAALLEMSRLEAGAVDLDRQGVALGPLVGEVVASFGAVMDGHVVDVEVGDVHVDADPSLLEHVLSCLIGNAVKHTPSGTRVWVRASATDGEAVVEVSDDGPGIAPGDVPYVLDQFFRGGPSTRRESSGLGLGLAVASRILLQHGSELEVRGGSEGASFRFRLPVRESAKAAPGR